ncbi:MAG: hypothetical protein WC827_01945 [Candidatus Paceibacterota bacterium]|jgi:hypothetical protein
MKKVLIWTLSTSTPLFVLAEGGGVADMITAVGTVINAILPVLVSLAVVYFIYQVIQYTIADGSGKDTKGIVWGLIGLTIIVGVWGFVNAIMSTLSISSMDQLN